MMDTGWVRDLRVCVILAQSTQRRKAREEIIRNNSCIRGYFDIENK
jgi:hypothetical protein